MRSILFIIILMTSYGSFAQLKHMIYIDCSQNSGFGGLEDLSAESGKLIDLLSSSNEDFIVFLSNDGNPEFYYKSGGKGAFNKEMIFQVIRNISPTSPDIRYDIRKIMKYIDEKGIRIEKNINYYFFSSLSTLSSGAYTSLIENLVHIIDSEPRDKSLEHVSVYIANKDIQRDSAKYKELLLDYTSSIFNY